MLALAALAVTSSSGGGSAVLRVMWQEMWGEDGVQQQTPFCIQADNFADS